MSAAVAVPFADLSLQWKQVRDKAMPEIEKLFASSAFCLGPWVEGFEERLAKYLGVKHCVAVSSGSAALHLAAIVANIQPGDKVLVPAQTFIATLWGVLYQGGIPILCDVDKDTAMIDPAELERRMEPGVKAIIPVHLFGQPAPMKAMMEFAAKHKLTLIEDVAQAIGARYGGKRLGALGMMGCFSFYPGKNLGAAGESGLITTDDDALASRMRSLRTHGQKERYVHTEIGYNYRMEGIQGLILDQKLSLLDGWTDERRKIAQRYNEELKGLPIQLPQVKNGDHVWHLYVIRHPDRDKLRQYMLERGVETGLHYPMPIHRQPCLSHLPMDRNSYPNADMWANQCLSLPVFVGMADSQQAQVIDAIKGYFKKN